MRSTNRPYVSVKKENSVSSEKKQSLISSFFASTRPTQHIQEPGGYGGGYGGSSYGGSGYNRYNSLTTPEKVVASRSDSILSKAVNSNSEFDEFGSSDTSFGSPEIANFKNPMLNRSMGSQNGGGDSVKRDGIDGVVMETCGVEVVQQTVESPTSRKSPGLFVSGENDMKPPAMKRGALKLLEHLTGQPRKVPKLEKASVHLFSTGLSTLSVQLNEDQKSVLKSVIDDGLNVFYTGSAGTGKSVVLRELVKGLYNKYGTFKVGVTASTGLAAANIGGQTLHRFLAIGLGEGSAIELSRKIKKTPSAMKKWMTVKVLIIDEISMIDGTLFSKLDELAKILRKSQLPFGGIQLVCTGDFFQLPPVSKNGTAQFCFLSDSWKKTIQKSILLKQVFRQKGDTELISMLEALRYGNLNQEMVKKFSRLSRKVKYEDGLEPTELFPTREEVKRANQNRLDQIRSRSIKFKAQDSTTQTYYAKMLDNLMCEQILDLKEGAQVMYLKNLDDYIVNGSIGTVMFFMPSKLWDKVNEIYGIHLYNLDDQLLDELRLLSSRVGCSSNWTEPEEQRFNKIPEKRKSDFTRLANLAAIELLADMYPIVSFKTPMGDILIRVVKEEFSIDAGRVRTTNGGDSDKITRSQLPLLLSWALSIHKAQGQTIDRLRINLGKVFEKGQVYVALSRATNKEHLEVLNFDPKRIEVSPVVKDFYLKLFS